MVFHPVGYPKYPFDPFKVVKKLSPAISPICREPDSPRTGKVTQPAMSDVQQLVIATWGHPNHPGGKDDFHWYVGILGRGNGWFHCKCVILRTWSKLWFEHETGGFKQGIKIGSWSWWEWKSHVLFMEIWRMDQVIGVSFLSASIRLHQLGPNSMVSGWLPLPIERINIILMIEHEFAYVIDLDPLWPNTSLGILTTIYQNKGFDIYIYIQYILYIYNIYIYSISYTYIVTWCHIAKPSPANNKLLRNGSYGSYKILRNDPSEVLAGPEELQMRPARSWRISFRRNRRKWCFRSLRCHRDAKRRTATKWDTLLM